MGLPCFTHCLLVFGLLVLWTIDASAVDYTMNNSSNTVSCGTTNNFFDSGGSGGIYSSNENLTITFTPSTPGQYISLNFSVFNITDDFISFYDGSSTADPLIGTFTGTASPAIIGATNGSGAITVQFSSGPFTVSTGWEAAITCSATPVYATVINMTDGVDFTGCATTFYDYGGNVGNYIDNLTQTMTFYPETPGDFVSLNFTSFDIIDDFISFYDGTSTAAPLIGTFSGTTSPGVIGATTGSGAITVQFTSGGFTNRAGWEATISCSATPVYPTVVVMTDGASVTTCAATFYDYGGTANYTSNLNQTMTFYPAVSGQYVSLNFTSFNIIDDFISFYDGTSTAAPLMATYTSTSSPGVIGATNASGAITIEFTSGAFTVQQGWEATVSCSASPVGVTIVNMTDGVTITTCGASFFDYGGSGSNYIDNLSQTMTFSPGVAGQYISIDFTAFDIINDVISFYDGTSTSDPLIASYSGTATPVSIGATGPTGSITVVFTSGNFTTRAGWEATVSCNANAVGSTCLVMTDGANYRTCSGCFYDIGGSGSNYTTSITQTATIWPIYAGDIVSLTFSSFDIIDDVISFYDGTSTTDPLIGTYTGTTSPGTVTATNTTGALTVEFTSDAFTTRAGWEATIAPMSCSGTVVLPVELIHFSAEEETGRVHLNWATASELNNDYFTVERSLDGQQWEPIMMIPGAGNSSQVIHYTGVDEFPLDGWSYYRLKQTDFDGTFAYSQVVAVELGNVGGSEVNVYPNPTTGQLTLSGAEVELTEIQVLDVLGQDVTSSLNIVRRDQQIKLDLTGLPSGIYMVRTKTIASRVYKQ